MDGADDGSTFRWQVAYDRKGEEYWWEYDSNISARLEEKLRSGEHLYFDFDWNRKTNHYVADPVSGQVVNSDTQSTRKLRRVILPPASCVHGRND